MMRTRLCCLVAVLLLATLSAPAQNIPSPKEHFGFNIGDDYQLANYSQTEAYFKKLAAVSDRLKLVDIGATEEGRSQYMLVVSSPANLKNLDKYKQISQKLAHAENLTDDQARALAAEGKVIVWIDGGLHANEVVGAHQLIEMAWQLSSRQDAETKKILDNAIILLTHANPDGQELISNWYMRESKPEKRSLQQVPRLYEKYAGHDNNRDFFMLNLKETQNMGRQLFIEWLPQIMYNHHQTGPAGTVVAGPPFRDPFNYVFDPLVMTSLDAVGAAMINRLNSENKPGYTQRAGSPYSTWYNGGLRTVTYFHNMIGLLTEIIGGPNPTTIPLVPQRLIPSSANPNPVLPQVWRFRNSIDYSVSLNYGVLQYAIRHSDELLYNFYKMGRNSIERGEKDYWTLYPKRAAEVTEMQQRNTAANAGQRPGGNAEGPRGGGGNAASSGKFFDSVYKNPELRDARGYILPSDQADFPTAARFINALIRTGVLVHKASSDFTVAGKKYPAGSFIVKNNQAFRPHVIDLFEPQDHPNDFQYPGGPPIAPYDAAGWTLAYEMGIQFDRITENFDGPFERIPYGELQNVKGKVTGAPVAAGYLLNSAANNSFTAVNDLLKAGVEVFRSADAVAGSNFSQGSFFVPASAKNKTLVEQAAASLGIEISALAKRPVSLTRINPARIALWDTYGGSMPSGWMRYIMEQFHFSAEVIYPKDIDTGNLRSKYDIILFVGGAIPSVNTGAAGGRGGFGGFGGARPEDIPAEFHNMLGRITPEKSIPELKKFLEQGGNILTIGSSTNLAYHLGVPVKNMLTEMVNGQEKNLPGEKYYIPGSILRMKVDSTQQAAWGMSGNADVYFDASPVFSILPEAQSKGNVKPLAWFPDAKPLRSGWAWGQAYLEGGITAFEAGIGNGKLIAFGPEITFRAQTHGTFKFIFNQLYTASKAK